MIPTGNNKKSWLFAAPKFDNKVFLDDLGWVQRKRKNQFLVYNCRKTLLAYQHDSLKIKWIMANSNQSVSKIINIPICVAVQPSRGKETPCRFSGESLKKSNSAERIYIAHLIATDVATHRYHAKADPLVATQTSATQHWPIALGLHSSILYTYVFAISIACK